MSVAPTEGLSAEMTGYLPVHCVHQLIKMRTFRKHGFSIKVSTSMRKLIYTSGRLIVMDVGTAIIDVILLQVQVASKSKL